MKGENTQEQYMDIYPQDFLGTQGAENNQDFLTIFFTIPHVAIHLSCTVSRSLHIAKIKLKQMFFFNGR